MEKKRQEGLINRRVFFRRAVKLGAALSVFPILSQGVEIEGALAEGEPKPVDLAAPLAQALGYVHDVKNVDKTKFSRYQEGQGCKHCQYFSSPGIKVPGAEGSWGKCTLFPQNVVNEIGWCNSFASKPA